MENPTTFNLQGKKLAMENFEQLIFNLAQTQPNKPLPPATKALLQGRFNQFVSDYKTPDHPPYSWMIEVALGELNEKAGSSVESISQHIEERHNNLPPAHSLLLKHHLEKLVETEEIVVTSDKRYGFPGRLKVTKRKQRKRRQRPTRNSKKREGDEFKYEEIKQEASNEDISNQTKLEIGLSGLNLEVASAETLRQTSSPVTVNNREVVDELQPKYRRLKVVFKLKSADTTELLESKQEPQMVQSTKRRPGRPRKRAIVT